LNLLNLGIKRIKFFIFRRIAMMKSKVCNRVSKKLIVESISTVFLRIFSLIFLFILILLIEMSFSLLCIFEFNVNSKSKNRESNLFLFKFETFGDLQPITCFNIITWSEHYSLFPILSSLIGPNFCNFRIAL